MANPNLALIQEALIAYQAGDLDRLRELFDPEIEIVGGNGLINAGTYHGFEGFLDWIRQWEEAWDPVNYELQEVTEVTDSLFVVAVHTVGRGAGSGIPIDGIFGWLYEITNGRATRFHTYISVDEALEIANRLVQAAR
jgi:ketosteroid isomerase-like protein